ncbi:MAG: PqqD family protein [bacterium]|nr:PqqD family protein [bacterium]
MAPTETEVRRLRTRRVEWHDHDGQAVILDSKSSTIALNPTAAMLWRRLVEGVDRHGLVQALVAEFAIDEFTAIRDVETFLEGLAQRGLVAEAV